MMKKSVLITGASGLLGRAIYKGFKNDSNWNATGLAFSRASGDLVKVDLTKESDVDLIFEKCKPNIVIHSAAERKPDIVEKKERETQLLNVEATRFLCSKAAKAGVPVLYMSTDYVFDGKNPPFKETHPPNPLNKYGQSKLAGENVTLDVSQDNIILRVPILYGPVETIDESAVTVLYEKVKDTANNCTMSDYERRFPTHVEDVAEVIKQLINKRMEDNSVKGIYQWSGNENMTKYDMAIAMANALNLPTVHIKADKRPASGPPRPYNSQLDTHRIDALGINAQRPLKDAIGHCLQQFI